MRTRCAIGLAFGLLGTWQLACTGSVGEQLSEPPARPVTAAAGASGNAAEDPMVATVTPGTTGTTSGPLGAGGAGARDVEDDPAELPDPQDLPALPPLEFCDAPTKVLVASCGNGSCHNNPRATIGDFAVDSQRAYEFVDRVSRRHADCGKIIDTSDYSKSLLLTKITGDFESPRCGERMPVGSFLITQEQIDCLAGWLQQFQL